MATIYFGQREGVREREREREVAEEAVHLRVRENSSLQTTFPLSSVQTTIRT